jgi:hypothetical protein
MEWLWTGYMEWLFLRIKSVGLPIFLLVLLRSSRNPKFIHLCREGKDLLLFLSGGAPFSSEESSLVLVFCSIREGGNGNVGSFIIVVLLNWAKSSSCAIW